MLPWQHLMHIHLIKDSNHSMYHMHGWFLYMPDILPACI